jgi:RimJ/RimL family protein N-acetyltransferase
MIETERLTIRRFCENDYADLYEYLSDPSIYTFEPGKPINIDEAKMLSLQRSKENDFLAVVLRFTGKMIGHLYFRQIEPAERLTWELGYIFNPKYHGNGYATESASALVKYAFSNLGTHRVMARCNPDNGASWKLLERIGFTREAHFKKFGFVHRDSNGNPIWNDVFEYSLIDDPK